MIRKSLTKKKLIIFSIVLLIVYLGYLNRTSYIKSFSWKSNSSSKITDYIEFDNSLDLKGRTIVFEGKDYGTVILCVHKYLLVLNKEGDVCLYSNKGALKK